MPEYQYYALNGSREVESGKVEADSEAEAIKMLCRLGLHQIEIRAVGVDSEASPRVPGLEATVYIFLAVILGIVVAMKAAYVIRYVPEDKLDAVPCEIVDVSYGWHATAVAFRYSYQGREYESRNFSSWTPRAPKDFQDYLRDRDHRGETGAVETCYVPPQHPEAAVFAIGLRPSSLSMGVYIGLFLSALYCAYRGAIAIIPLAREPGKKQLSLNTKPFDYYLRYSPAKSGGELHVLKHHSEARNTSAAFRIFSFDGPSLDTISRLLQLVPTNTHERPVRAVGGRATLGEVPAVNPVTGTYMPSAADPHRGPGDLTDMWVLATQGTVESKNLEEHLAWLLERLDDRAEQLRALHDRGCYMDIRCSWESGYGYGGPTFSAPLLRRLSELNLGLVLDVTFPNER